MVTKKKHILAVPDSEKDWRARSDMHTLKDAEEVRSNPARHSAAKKAIGEEMKKLARVSMGTRPKPARRK
jgi:PHD/YefM family antitoxin component YafN of YafNO toxin-antitoxin module